MKKPFKVMTTTAMVAALTATTLVPAVVVQADEKKQDQLEVSEVIFKSIEGPLGKIPMEIYNKALTAGLVDPNNVLHVLSSTGSVYTMEDYNKALTATGKMGAALELLEKNGEKVTDKVLPGKFLEDGNVTVNVDEQPEDRLNETFFYNVA